jgi:siderophore synthetase component
VAEPVATAPAPPRPAGDRDPAGEWLAGHRPDLAGRYRRELPGARAAVLARLWGALTREPVPGIRARQRDGAAVTVTTASGRRLRGPAAHAEPFALSAPGFAVEVDGVAEDRPERLVAALGAPVAAAGLAAELADSVTNLALARAAQPPPDAGPPLLARLAAAGAAGLADAEQLVVDGHPLHPCCRTRTGMSTAEVLAYAPEHHPSVALELVEVPPERWHSTGRGAPPRLPVHPWQRDHVLDRYPDLRPATGRWPARPLMSLRTVAPLTAPGWHLKTAVDVQMTSAVRTVSPAALHNGPALSALLARLTADEPSLAVLREVAAGAVVVDGEPCRSLAFVLRQAPQPVPGEVVAPLAALTAASPVDGRPLLVEVVDRGYAGHPAGFLTALARLAFPPLLRLLHLGVALEAHGQNLLVVLRDARAVRLLYRDLGGVRVSPRRLARHGIAAPPLHGDVRCDDEEALRTKLAAALLSTVVGELVAVLAREYGVSAPALWARVGGELRAAYRRLPARARGDAAALLGPSLPVKAMTAMRLSDRPTDDQWCRLPSPLSGAA